MSAKVLDCKLVAQSIKDECKAAAEELKAKGKAHSYCTAKMVVSRTSGIKIDGKWYELVSAKQVIRCKLFEPVKGAR